MWKKARGGEMLLEMGKSPLDFFECGVKDWSRNGHFNLWWQHMEAMIIGCGACDKINMSRKVMRTWFLSPTYMSFEREFFFLVQLSLWSSICDFCVKWSSNLSIMLIWSLTFHHCVIKVLIVEWWMKNT